MPRRFSCFQPGRRLGRIVLGALLVFACLCPVGPAGADLFYKVQKIVRQSDLDPAAGQGIPMVVTGLNAAGCVVGFFTDRMVKVHGQDQTTLNAFVWNDATQTLTNLSPLLGGSSMALGVNNAGMVAGIYWPPGFPARQNGFVWQGGAPITFQSPEGGDIDAVVAINAGGQVIGTYYAAAYDYKRAFFWDGITSTDLGDFGDPDNEFIWPQALNDFGQVVGTVYDQTLRGASLPTAFFWQNGSLSALDGVGDLGPSTAQAVNNAGQVAGGYFTGSQIVGQQGPPAGYYWFDGQALDLGDLGGGGTTPFAIDAGGNIFGTSYDAAGRLHLFHWNPSDLIDLGAAQLAAGDLDFQLTGANAFGGLAGFVNDASGNLQATVYAGGVQQPVTALLPAYLAFTKMSSAYGSQVLINDAGMIACAGTDAAGQQMALLLSVDPDTDNDGLPDSWEMQYYHHLGVGKDDYEAGGGGLTNWQAYQQGTDPNDFYDGQAPRLTMMSGNNQTAAPGSFVPAPLVVQLSNNLGTPAGGSAVTFSIASGGGQLQTAREASPKTTVSVLTDANGQAKVFFRTPGTAGITSSINATFPAASLSVTPVFSETTDSNGPVNPAPTDPNNPVGPEPVPVESCACIDISGAVQGNNDVDRVVLNDSGVAAFGFGSNNTYSTYQFVNGQLNHVQDLTLEVDTETDDGLDEVIYQPEIIDSQGTIYGMGSETIIDDDNDDDDIIWGTAIMCRNGNATRLSPPLPFRGIENSTKAIYLIWANNGSITGIAGGYFPDPNDPSNNSYRFTSGGIICFGESKTIFDPQLVAAGSSDPNVQVINDWFLPIIVNSVGSAAGGRTSGYFSPLSLWDGTSKTFTDFGQPGDGLGGLNDQSQVVVQTLTEGYLWESGTRTVLVDHLPATLTGQISNIQPFSISNQTAPGSDATIYILATATVNGAPNTTIVCTRDNDGDWSFAQVQPPDGTTVSQYVSINAHGIIASIGSVSTSSATDGLSQTSDDPSPSPNQVALVGPLVKLGGTIKKKCSWEASSMTLFGAPYTTVGSVPIVADKQYQGSMARDVKATNTVLFRDGSSLVCTCPFIADGTMTANDGVSDGKGNLTWSLSDNPRSTLVSVDKIPVSDYQSFTDVFHARTFFTLTDGITKTVLVVENGYKAVLQGNPYTNEVPTLKFDDTNSAPQAAPVQLQGRLPKQDEKPVENRTSTANEWFAVTAHWIVNDPQNRDTCLAKKYRIYFGGK